MSPTSTDAPTPLRRVREARGLSLEDVASAAGVSVRTVSDAELRRARPRRSTKAVIAQALELDPRELWPEHQPDEF
jgi:transcriptional regulator with XRE-family HTH domain